MSFIAKHKRSYNKIPLFLTGYYALLCLYSSRWFISDVNAIPLEFIDRPGTAFLNLMSSSLIQMVVNLSPLVFLITSIKSSVVFLRILSFLVTYISISYLSSQGSSSYTELIPLIWMSFFSMFCQYKADAKTKYRYRELLKVHLVIGSLLLPYIISGFWKLIYGGFYQLFWGDISIWNPNALLYTVKTYLLRIESTSWLYDYLSEYPWLIWFTLAYITLWEVALVFIFWFPKYWKKVCFQINIFHFLVIWSLDILFYPQIGLFLLLFFVNPLDSEEEFSFNIFR